MNPTISTQPFNEIALCLSGGGYRAAAFHLGTLDMLDQLGLLANVNRLSTVSGGTIVGMTYAVWTVEGKSFGAFYKDFYTFLKETNAIQEALDQLYTTPSPSGANDLSLIRSAAGVYAEKLFQEKQFGLLMDKTKSGTPFKELIFNTTEFRIGNSFRFRASNNPDAVVGNENFQVSKQSYSSTDSPKLEVAKQIRLNDIVAASSCFPAAFEPIRFPDDFQWTNLEKIRETLESGFKDKNGNPVFVPLMDGGIYDNQGLGSMLLTDDIKHIEISLFIISDVSQRDDAVLNFPVKARKGWLSLDMIWWMGLAILFLSLISAIAVFTEFIRKWRETPLSLPDFIYNNLYESLFVYGVPLVLSIAVVIIFGWVYRIGSRKQKVVIAGQSFELWKYIRHLTVPDLLDFLEARVSSLVALTGQVFMKRIRGLITKGIMATNERRDRVAFNYIYDMLLSKSHSSVIAKDADIEPSDALKTVAERAEKMATTLWFANEDDLKNLIVCGQASVCYSILRFLLKHHEQETKDSSSPFFALFQLAKSKWLDLKQDPNCFLTRTR